MQPPVRAEELFIEATLLSHPLESEEYSMFNVPWKKQYDIWRHGDELIANATSPRDFEVAIMHLQGAVEQRDTILEQSYQFKTCPWFGKGLSHYAIMAELGIIRPSLKDPLRQLRNRIAHEVNDVVLERKQCRWEDRRVLFRSGLSHYAIMAELGIIRPSLKDPLRQLRNRIAHEVNDVVLERKQCEHLSDR